MIIIIITAPESPSLSSSVPSQVQQFCSNSNSNSKSTYPCPCPYPCPAPRHNSIRLILSGYMEVQCSMQVKLTVRHTVSDASRRTRLNPQPMDLPPGKPLLLIEPECRVYIKCVISCRLWRLPPMASDFISCIKKSQGIALGRLC